MFSNFFVGLTINHEKGQEREIEAKGSNPFKLNLKIECFKHTACVSAKKPKQKFFQFYGIIIICHIELIRHNRTARQRENYSITIPMILFD